jgi:LmbE family N-acetylglucosaminyl deacetylase
MAELDFAGRGRLPERLKVNLVMDDRPNIILSPHFDDAVLSLGGLIARAPERAIVVTIFAGTPPVGINGGWDRRSGFTTAAAAVRARCEENTAALAVIGVLRGGIRNLDYLDRQYRPPGSNEKDAALQSAIAADVRHLVEDYGGSVNLFAPASTWHPDHRIVTDAVLHICRNGECPRANIFLCQDQPYTYLELRRKSLLPLRFADFNLLTDIVGQRSNVAITRHFIDLQKAEVLAKTKAIHQYKSQFSFIRHLLCKMIADFSYYQAGDAPTPARYVEVAYRVAARDAPRS